MVEVVVLRCRQVCLVSTGLPYTVNGTVTSPHHRPIANPSPCLRMNNTGLVSSSRTTALRLNELPASRSGCRRLGNLKRSGRHFLQTPYLHTPEPQRPRPSRGAGCHASADNRSTGEQHGGVVVKL